MATIRELQASFVARATGMKSTIQDVKKDIQGLATDTKKLTAGMSTDFRKGTAGINKSVSGLSKSFRSMSTSASKHLESIGKATQNTGKRLESWGSDIQDVGKTASKALSPLTAFYATAALTGGKRMAANEQLDILMGNTFQTADAYDQAWKSVNNLTKGTAFMNSDVGGWLSQLVASNVELDKSEDIMKSILDFSVGSGQMGIEGEIHDIVMKAVRSGGWDQMTIDMLAQRGFNLAGHIANVLGVDLSVAQEMLKDGTIGMAESLDYFNDAVQVGSKGAGGNIVAMADSAKKGGETFAGAFTNMKAAVAQLGEKMWKGGAWEQLKRAMNSMYEFLNELGDSLEPISVIIGNILGRMVDWIQKLMTAFINLRPKTQSLIASLSVIGAVLGPAIFMFGAFIGIVGKALAPIGALFLKLSQLFGIMGKKGLMGVLEAVGKRLSFLTGPIGIIIGVLITLYTTSETFRKALHNMISSIFDYGKVLYGQLKPAFDTVIDSVKMMLESFKGAGNGMDSIGSAVAPLLSIIGLLVKVIMKGLAGAISLVLPLLSGLARAIGPLIKTVASLISFIINLGTAIFAVFTLDFEKAMKYFKATFQSAIDFFVNLWGVFTGFFSGFIATIMVEGSLLFKVWSKLKGAAEAAWGGIASVFGRVKELFTDMLVPMGEFFTSLGDWFAKGFNSISEAVKEAGRGIADKLTGGISQGLEGTSSMFGNIGNRIVEAIRNSINKTIDYFANIGGTISDSIGGGLVRGAGDFVRSYIDNLIESFKSVGGILKLAAPSIIGVGARMLGLAGPIGLIISAIMTMINVFKNLYKTNEGFRNGIKEVWNEIQNIFSSVWDTIKPIFKEFGDAFGEIAKELGPEFAKTKEVIMQSIEELKPTFVELGETFSELGKVFSDIFKEISQVVGDVIKSIVPLWLTFQKVFAETIFELVKVVIPALLEVFKNVFPVILAVAKVAINAIVENLTLLIGVVLSVVKAVLPALLEIVKSVFPLILAVISTVLPMLVTLFSVLIKVAMDLVKSVIPLILSVIKAVLPVVLSIVKMVIPVIITIIVMLIDIVMNLVKMVVPLILAVIKAVFPAVLAIIKTVIPIIASLIKVFVNIVLQLAKVVIPLILMVIQKVFPIIQKVIEIAVKAVVGMLKLLVGIIKNVVVPAIEFILKIVQVVFPVITKVIEGALNIIIGVLDFFVALFTGNWSGMWDAVKKIISSALKIVWAVVKGSFDLILLFAKTIFNALASFFGMIWNKISSIFSSVIKTIVRFVKNRFDDMKNNITTIFNAVKNFITTVWNGILAFFREVIGKIVDFVKSRFENLKNNITTIFNAIRDTAKRVWNTIKDNIVKPITDGVKTAIDKFVNLRTRITDIFKTIKDNVFGYVSDMVKKVKDMPGVMAKGIKDAAYKVYDSMKSLAGQMVKGLGKGVNGVITGINWVMGKLNVPKDKHLGKWTVPKYAKGTDGHPSDGLAIVGDGRGSNAGPELIQTPDGRQALSPDSDTLVNLQKGTKVLSAKNTRAYLAGIPRYADGVGGFFGKVGQGIKKGASKVADWSGEVWDYIKNPSKLLNVALNALGVSAPSGGTTFGKVAKGGFNKVKESAIDYVKEKLGAYEEEGGDGGGPVTFGNLRKTSSYGMRFHPIHKQWRLHAGDDYGGPIGTAIKSTTSGTVDHAGRLGGFGNMVRVRNGAYTYTYAHLSRIMARLGEVVKKGKVIGALGNTGDSTGPHLHYEVRRGGRPVKPGAYKDGGIVDQKQLAWIADGGWAESIISHDPAKKNRQQKIWQQTGDSLGFTDGRGSKDILGELKRIAKAVERDFILNMDSKKVGELTEPHVTNKQQREQGRKRRFPK